MSGPVKKIKLVVLSGVLIIAILAYVRLKSSMAPPTPFALTPTRNAVARPGYIDDAPTGIPLRPEISQTETADAKLLPGTPTHFPVPAIGQVISSYTGQAAADSNISASGYSLKFKNMLIGDVLENYYLNEENDPDHALPLNWMIDEPSDPANSQVQKIRGHNKSGEYFWLTVTQENSDSVATVDFLIFH